VADQRIFLSHAFADLPVAKLLRDTLVRGGVPTDRIFFSSARSTGIPSGQDVGGYLREQLGGAALVIELISTNFLSRPMCLMELGGAWAMKKSTYPVLLPPLTRAQATEAIGNILINDLGNDAEVEGIFSELSDRIETDLGLRTQRSAWSEAVADFNEAFGAAQAKIASTAKSPSATDSKTSSAIALDGDVRLTNVSVAGRELRGEATNTTDGPFVMVIIEGTFYTDAGSIAGTVKDIVSNLKADQTRTFTLRNIPKHATFKFDTDLL
jgi:hypothetical protein